MNIIFVCTGNTCRSPMAEVIANDYFNKMNLGIKAVSRGVSVYCPSSASINSILAVEKYGLDLSRHLSKPISAKDIEEADLILTMTNSHKKVLLGACNDVGTDIFTLNEFVNGTENDIVDPFGRELDVYQSCAEEIKHCIEEIPSILEKKKLK